MRRRRNISRANHLEIITNCGPTDGTFDPSITTSKSTTITCDYGDGSVETLTGTLHNFSHTYATAGPHKAVFRGVPLENITAIDCNNDNVLLIKNIERLVGLTSIANYQNTSIAIDLSQYPASLTSLIASYNTIQTGSIDSIKSRNLVTLNLRSCPLITGNLSSLCSTLSMFYLCDLNSGVIGSLLDLPSTLNTVYVFLNTHITAASIAHLIVIRDIRIYSMGWLQADVDLVIDSMWTARAAYTYNGALCQMGGTNGAASGNQVAPIEGSDWHNDGLKWIPLTAKAKVWDLLNDVNTEGFKKWSSISVN